MNIFLFQFLPVLIERLQFQKGHFLHTAGFILRNGQVIDLVHFLIGDHIVILHHFLKFSRQLGSDDPAAQQLLAVRELADSRLSNDGSLAELHAAVQQVLERVQHFERPGWDDYFMAIARVVASRSNCVKRKVAAVITKDRRIISTGYNGTPRGTRNCNEGGCPRCNSFAPGGTRLDECLCSHGEENALTQAAYHGVSLRGATIYTTLSPCLQCTKMIINAGLVEVVYNAQYPLGTTALGLLEEAGLMVRQLADPE